MIMKIVLGWKVSKSKVVVLEEGVYATKEKGLWM